MTGLGLASKGVGEGSLGSVVTVGGGTFGDGFEDGWVSGRSPNDARYALASLSEGFVRKMESIKSWPIVSNDERERKRKAYILVGRSVFWWFLRGSTAAYCLESSQKWPGWTRGGTYCVEGVRRPVRRGFEGGGGPRGVAGYHGKGGRAGLGDSME